MALVARALLQLTCRFVHLGDVGRGLALMARSKYGFAAHDNILRLSLLRSPKNPDNEVRKTKESTPYSISLALAHSILNSSFFSPAFFCF